MFFTKFINNTLTILIYIHTHIQVHTYRQTDRQTYRHTYIYIIEYQGKKTKENIVT